MTSTRFINLFAGPGAGKSTIAAGVFSLLKQRGLDIELVPEFAKELVWEGSPALENQSYVTARQFYVIKRLDNKCKWVITDSPAFLGAAYCTSAYPRSYIDTLYWWHTQTQTEGLNFFLERGADFDPKGRVHGKHESQMIDGRIVSLMEEYNIDFKTTQRDVAIHDICEAILLRELADSEQSSTLIEDTDVSSIAVLGGTYD